MDTIDSEEKTKVNPITVSLIFTFTVSIAYAIFLAVSGLIPGPLTRSLLDFTLYECMELTCWFVSSILAIAISQAHTKDLIHNINQIVYLTLTYVIINSAFSFTLITTVYPLLWEPLKGNYGWYIGQYIFNGLFHGLYIALIIILKKR